MTLQFGEVTQIPGQAAEGSFAGGWRSDLTLGKTKAGEPQELSADTMAAYVANQLADLKQGDRAKYEKKVYMLPKHLDEKVARLHLKKIGVELDVLTPAQAEYLGISASGPFKPEYYRY